MRTRQLRSHGADTIRASELNEQTDALRKELELRYHCRVRPVVSIPVKVEAGRNSWSGIVDAFDLAEHPNATRCYAWQAGSKQNGATACVLKIPPISCAEEAVRSWLRQTGKPAISPSARWAPLFKQRGALHIRPFGCLFLGLLLTLFLFSGSRAQATTVIQPTFDELVTRAELILEGTVMKVESAWLGEGAERRIVTYVTLAVEDTIKGDASATYSPARNCEEG